MVRTQGRERSVAGQLSHMDEHENASAISILCTDSYTLPIDRHMYAWMYGSPRSHDMDRGCESFVLYIITTC